MISTSVMIKLGRVEGNKMIDMQLSNNKLIDRGVRMIMKLKKIDYNTASKLINKFKSVRAVMENYDK